MPQPLYRMDDRPDAPSKAAIACRDEAEARAWNTPERGFGVFRTVNSFDGARRKENLLRIKAWAIDMDEGTKEEMAAKLRASPLVPTAIVETKRGYQAYWNARRDCGPKANHWNALVLERLVPHYGADKNARDLARILRQPGFLHLKDPAAPFLVRTVWEHYVEYSERQMAEAFVWRPNIAAHIAEQRAESNRAVRPVGGYTPGDNTPYWDAIAALDCRDALERLSGSGIVGGERFTFRVVSNGNANIFCDGKGTSCWIDKNGKIGSLSHGGPLITNWLRWYRADWKEIHAELQRAFPHLAEIDAACKASGHRRAA